MISFEQQTQTNIQSVCPHPQQKLHPLTDLSKIFPDIQGELCSRHSSLMGKLKTTFNKLYDKMEPTHYVIVKGNTHIIGTQYDEVELSMGLENGIILLVCKTFPNSNIYINGNHMDEEIILNQKGKLQQGLYQMSEEIQTIYQKSIQHISQDQLYGGIMYVHANIPQGFYNYKNSLLIAMFLGSLIMSGSLDRYTMAEIISKIGETKLVDQILLQKLFYDYENRQLSLMVGSTMFKIPLDNDIKLLFCKLDLAKSDIKHSQKNIKEQRQSKARIVEWMQTNLGVKSFYEAFQNELQVDVSKFDLGGADGQQKIEYIRLVNAEIKELKALCQFSNNKISVEDLLSMKWLIDSQVRQIFSEQVTQLVENIKQKTKIEACTIVEGEYIIMAVDKRRYTQLIVVLRQLLHKGELKSRSHFKLEEELIETRWGSDEQIGQKIFVSVPSKGIAIFDPKEAIWFD